MAFADYYCTGEQKNATRNNGSFSDKVFNFAISLSPTCYVNFGPKKPLINISYRVVFQTFCEHFFHIHL